MTLHDRRRWDNTYRSRVSEPFPVPDPLLFPYVPAVDPARGLRALDLAGGVGQNALWLAAQGYTVDLMDISRVALRRAQEEMGRRHLRNLNVLQVDLDHALISADTYDVVTVFRYLNRDLFPVLRTCVRPGGRIVYETFNSRVLSQRPDMNREYLLEPGELAGVFADWKRLYHVDGRSSTQLVAMRPTT